MKNLKISDKAHKRLKTYCAEKGFKIGEFATILVETAMKNIAPTTEELQEQIVKDRENH